MRSIKTGAKILTYDEIIEEQKNRRKIKFNTYIPDNANIDDFTDGDLKAYIHYDKVIIK